MRTDEVKFGVRKALQIASLVHGELDVRQSSEQDLPSRDHRSRYVDSNDAFGTTTPRARQPAYATAEIENIPEPRRCAGLTT
jgi:hypothetical protein